MAEQDKVYRCLNPVGISAPVETFPLAPRLNTVAGKNIYLSLTGEWDIVEALEKQLKRGYPDVDWKIKRTAGLLPLSLSDEEMKTCDGLIQAVCW